MLPIHTDRSSIRAILMEWMSSQGSMQQQLPIADLRPLDAFLEKRLCTAAYVPSDDLASHCFWLPDKDVPFGVVLPAHTDLPIQDCCNLPEFLESRKWAGVAWYIKDCPDLWAVASELGLVEGAEYSKAELLQRFVFRPCPLLFQEIHRIESSLLLPPPDTPPAGAATPHPQAPLTCLEPGCGSGRNIVWLATRHSSPWTTSSCGTRAVSQASEQQPGGSPGDLVESKAKHRTWEVLGLDNWYAALARVQQMCLDTLLPPAAVKLWYCGVNPGTGLIDACSLPTSASKHAAGADANTHISSPPSSGLPQGCWHVILCVRFLERAFLQHVPALLAPGGFLLFNTFLDMEGTRRFGRPKGENHLLQRQELASLFGPAQGFEILRDEVEQCRDGRELSMFVARKLSR